MPAPLYYGVQFVANRGQKPWRATVFASGKRHLVGNFSCGLDAARAGNAARLALRPDAHDCFPPAGDGAEYVAPPPFHRDSALPPVRAGIVARRVKRLASGKFFITLVGPTVRTFETLAAAVAARDEFEAAGLAAAETVSADAPARKRRARARSLSGDDVAVRTAACGGAGACGLPTSRGRACRPSSCSKPRAAAATAVAERPPNDSAAAADSAQHAHAPQDGAADPDISSIFANTDAHALLGRNLAGGAATGAATGARR
jgi:hypothetical protein